MKPMGLKCLSFLVVAIAIAVLSGCQGNARKHDGNQQSMLPSDTASIAFRQYEHDFGKIAEGEKVGCIFTFVNKGTAPLVIKSAVTSCGCTVPKYDRNPVPPGGSGTLEVIFDSSGRSGLQTKTITVSSNATKPVIILKIAGEVVSNSNNN